MQKYAMRFFHSSVGAASGKHSSAQQEHFIPGAPMEVENIPKALEESRGASLLNLNQVHQYTTP